MSFRLSLRGSWKHGTTRKPRQMHLLRNASTQSNGRGWGDQIRNRPVVKISRRCKTCGGAVATRHVVMVEPLPLTSNPASDRASAVLDVEQSKRASVNTFARGREFVAPAGTRALSPGEWQHLWPSENRGCADWWTLARVRSTECDASFGHITFHASNAALAIDPELSPA